MYGLYIWLNIVIGSARQNCYTSLFEAYNDEKQFPKNIVKFVPDYTETQLRRYHCLSKSSQ